MGNVDFFYERLGRLKAALRLSKDKEVAEVLGLGEKAFNARKTRGAFPEKELRALAQQRPELGIDVDYVLTGITSQARALLDAKEARIARAVDAGMDFGQVRAMEAAQGVGPAPEQIQRLAGMLPKLRSVEFNNLLSIVESITELRAALESRVDAAPGLPPMSMSQSIGVPLEPNEQTLLDNYRNAPSSVQLGVQTTLEVYAPTSLKTKRAR